TRGHIARGRGGCRVREGDWQHPGNQFPRSESNFKMTRLAPHVAVECPGPLWRRSPMVTRRVALLAALLLCTLPVCRTLLFAVPPPLAAPFGQDSDFTMEGKITEKSAGKLTINSGDNIIFHVLYNDKTEITKKD